MVSVRDSSKQICVPQSFKRCSATYWERVSIYGKQMTVFKDLNVSLAANIHGPEQELKNRLHTTAHVMAQKIF